jgi:hypothetical protein
VEHQGVPTEEAAGDYRSTEGSILGPASSCKMPRTAEETDPGHRWVPAEVCCRWWTRRAVPALREGHSRRGPGRTVGSRMEEWSMKQQWTEDTVVQ